MTPALGSDADLGGLVRLPDRLFDATYDFPPAIVPPSTYLIAATPRCGSHYLGHLLFATQQLGAPLEYISVSSYDRWSRIVGSNNSADVFAAIMARRTSPNGWFGIQAHWFHLANLVRFGISREVLDFRRIIWIRRRDVVDQAVSFAIALQTGVWTSFHEASCQPAYDCQAIARCANSIKSMDLQWQKFLASNNTPCLMLYYEDICGGEREAVYEILDWFGLPRRAFDLSVPLQKQASEINADWRERFLRDTRRR